MELEHKKEIITNFNYWKESIRFRDKLLSLWSSFDRFNRDIKKLYNLSKVTDLYNKKEYKKVFSELNKDDFFNFIKNRKRGDGWNGWVYNIKEGKVYEWNNIENIKEFWEIIRTIVNNTDHWEKILDTEINEKLLEQASIIFESFLENLYIEFWILNN